MATQTRMDRDQFFQKLEGKNEKDLGKLLWELYWRGKAEVRARIEGLLDPEVRAQTRKEREQLDPDWVQGEIETFAGLLRSGAYMGGTRDVSRQERSKWRLTFRNHMAAATTLVAQGDLEAGGAALELLIDLLCEMRGYDYVHSQDPVTATGIVVSDKVEFLWRTILEREGFQALVQAAPGQFIRWETAYGWTRMGWDRLCEKERPLAEVLSLLLQGPDAWTRFADAYLDALDRIRKPKDGRDPDSYGGWNSQCRERSRNLEAWHQCLHARLRDGEGGERLFRIAAHPALAGPETDCFLARLAWETGQADRARALMTKCLHHLPGHKGFISFAREVGVPVPAKA